MAKIQPLLDDIAEALEAPELSDIDFWQNILTSENLTHLKQAIASVKSGLAEQQVDYTAKISQLLLSEDPNYWQQGIELLHSLNDAEVWDSITSGCSLTDKGLFESQHFNVSFGLFRAWCENPFVTHEDGFFDFSLFATVTKTPLLSHLVEGYKWRDPNTVLEQALAPLAHFKRLRLSINTKGLRDLDFLTQLPNIVELKTQQERHETLKYSFLEGLSNLERLTMRGNVHIANLRPLSGLTKLKVLEILLPTNDSFCANMLVTELSALSALSELQTLTLQKMAGLSSLDGLQNARNLKTLSLSRLSSLTSLDGISTDSLTDLNITCCGTLSDISALRGAPQLTDVVIEGQSLQQGRGFVATQLSSLDGLANCLELRRLHFIGAGSHLTNIDGLRDCPNLQEFTISSQLHRDLTEISALSHCTKLRSVKIISSGCWIEEFPDLRQCSALETIEIERAQFPNLEGLRGCPALKKVRVISNRKLTSLAGLMASPLLEEIHVPHTENLQEIGDLCALPNLHKFNLSTNGYTTKTPRFTPCASNILQPCPPKNDGMLVTRAAVNAYQDKVRLLTAIQNNDRAVVESFVSMEYLDLHGCHSLTQPGLLQLLSNLAYLNLRDCPGLPFQSWQKEYNTAEKVAGLLRKIAKRFPLS